MIPSFPKIGASNPTYGSSSVQNVPTPAVVKAYSGNYSYSDSRASMNDAPQVAEADAGDQGSFTI
jgi:hypothetical protein